MGFRLEILDGADKGKSYAFDRAEITVGRIAENDLVLADPGLSRKHLSIRKEKNAYLLKDLGSSNGTRLNGKSILEKVLRSGDLIGTGNVKIRFQIVTAKEGREQKDNKRKKSTSAPPNQSGGRDKAAKPIIRSAALRKTEKARGRRQESSARAAAQPEGARQGQKGDAEANLQASPIGKVTRWFKSRNPRTRGILVALFLLLLLLGMWAAFSGGQKIIRKVVDHSNDIFVAGQRDGDGLLTRYGNGQTTIHCRHQAVFRFRYRDGRATVVFQVAEVDKKQEVAILLNQMNIGFAPIAFSQWSEKVYLDLDRKQLVENAENELAFVNTLNAKDPKGNEHWAVRVDRIVESPLPKPDRVAAKQAFAIARNLLEIQNVAAGNAYKALKFFKKTRDYLELESAETRLDIYQESIEMIERLEIRLEKAYRNLLFDAEQAKKFSQHAKAKEIYRQIKLTFPNPQDPRHVYARRWYDRYR